MQPIYEHSGVKIFHGSCLSVLEQLPSESINTCITSPPYWGLRDYGTGKWTGGTLDCSHRVGGQVQDNKAKGAIIAGVRPGVDASVCLDCGALRVDKQIGLERTPEEYVSRIVEVFREVRRVLREDGTLWLNLGDSYNAHPGQRKTTDAAGPKQVTNEGAQGAPSRYVSSLKPKDLVGIPWRVAFALQEDGWWLRSDIIWAKPAPMPESVEDRPTRSHEYIFLMTKAEKYYYDFESIKEPSSASGGAIKATPSLIEMSDRGNVKRKHDSIGVHGNLPGRDDAGRACNGPGQETRNKRDVWTINTDPFPEAHFATFPPSLILPCVLAGCPTGGTVLDPFSGAGTTALVAKENARNCIGIELNQEYISIASRRLSQDSLFATI